MLHKQHQQQQLRSLCSLAAVHVHNVRWTRSKSPSLLSPALLATRAPPALPLSPPPHLPQPLPRSENGPPTPSPPPPIQRTNSSSSNNNNNNPHFATSIPIQPRYSMPLPIHVAPSQNSVLICFSKPSARASLERSNSASTRHGPRKSPSSS